MASASITPMVCAILSNTSTAFATMHRKQTIFGVRFTYGSGTPFTATVGEMQKRPDFLPWILAGRDKKEWSR